MRDTISVEVNCNLIINNVCNEEDLTDITLEELVDMLIKEEGLLGIVEDYVEVISVKKI